MKSLNLFASFMLAALVLVSIESCDKHPGCTDANATNYNVNATSDNGSCTYAVNFYFDQHGPNATVNINNQTGMVTGSYQTGAPACGVNVTGCANFTLPVGSYPYTATSSLTSWSGGTVVVNGSGCQDVLLQQSTGSVAFYTANSTYGNITVNINGTSGSITGYVTGGGTPLCGANYCATFDLVPAVYNYTATSSQGGATWNSSITVTQDGCAAVQLQ